MEEEDTGFREEQIADSRKLEVIKSGLGMEVVTKIKKKPKE